MQFTLFRLMLAVACFAVAFAAWSLGENGTAQQFDLLWLILAVVMPGVAAWLLTGKWWIGVAVVAAFAAILYVQVLTYFPPPG